MLRRSSRSSHVEGQRGRAADTPLNVILLMRHSLPGQFSIERVFNDVVPHLGECIRATIVRVPHPSRGIVPRVRNLIFTARLRADIIHVTGDIQYCSLGVRRRRCVLTVADLVSVKRLKGFRRLLLTLLWYQLPCWWASRVTVISPFTGRELVDLMPRTKSRIVVVPCPVSDAFTRGIDHRGTSGAQRVLQVGTGAHKNLEGTLRAINDLNVELRIVGPISQEQSEELLRSGIRFSQVQDLSDADMVEEYRQADVLVFASLYEGFGLPIVEAQAIGIPVITSAIDPMAWVAGNGAILVHPRDYDAIRCAICDVLDNTVRRNQLRAGGFDNVRRFTASSIAQQYAAVYATVAERALRGPCAH